MARSGHISTDVWQGTVPATPPVDSDTTRLPIESPVHEAPAITRVTVNLSPRAARCLHQIVDLTGDTKTEAINKALQAYGLIQESQHRGGGAWIQDDASGKPTQIRFY